MGCKQTKVVKIQPVGAAEVRHDNINLRKTNSEVSEYDIDEHTGSKVPKNKNKRTKSSKTKDSLGSCVSLDDKRSIPDSERGNSASSKFSNNSSDSGLGDDYAHVITEESDPSKIKDVEDNFIPNESLDLGITGVACPTRLSAKDKDRMEESMILQSLREEGLIARPHAQSSGGTSFEIIAAENSLLGPGIPRPPPRLAKLEKRRKKKKQLTEDEIREKLEKAERRKKRKEEERLEKIRELEKSKNSVNTALEQFMVMQEEKDKEVHKKIDMVSDNREKRLRQIKEKMAKRAEHAALVRKRKEMALLEGNTNPMDSEYPPEQTSEQTE